MSAAPTVVVPVFGGLDDLRRCLDSVFRHADGLAPFDLRVVDDASPGDDVRAFLAEVERDRVHERLTVVHNQVNQGFVRTCNQAMRTTAGDVVLLNSDTVVTAGWLDRLAKAARRPGVATVTPLTNFGSLATLSPRLIEAFDLAGPDPRIDDCAAFVGVHTVGRLPEVISGVGFCLYLTRAALDACGLFDEEAFGLGYGEEVDLCLRASGQGFRHLVDDRTYVYHRGGVSFSERRAEGLKRSSEIIHRRYPFFRTVNLQERAEDPLRISFAALEQGLDERDSARPHVLQLLHSKPGELGGTEKHFWRLVDGLLREVDISVLQPCVGGFLLTTVWRIDGRTHSEEHLLPGHPVPDSAIDDPLAAAALETVLDLFDIDAVHVQNIVHHSLAPLAVLADFPGPVACSVRDLYLACPHHWLLYRNQQACGIPEDLSVCARCLPETRGLDVDHLRTFRATVEHRLATVDKWVFASQSAVDFFQRVHEPDPEAITLIEHGAIIDTDRGPRLVDEARILDEPLRVAFVGIGWAKKGLPAVNELAEMLADTSIEIHHFGELRDPISPLIHEHGWYDNNVLPELLHRTGIQVVLLPGAFVETFGHVMTESLIAGLPVIGNRHGALGERIRAGGIGWTIEPEDVDGMRDLIVNLDRSRPELLRVSRLVAELTLATVEDTVEQYAALYRHPADAKPDDRGATPTVEDEERERMQRELRAMATVNRRLQVQLTEADRKGRSARPSSRSGSASPASSGAGPVTPGPGPVARLQATPMLMARVRRSVARRGPAGAARKGMSKAVDKGRRSVRARTAASGGAPAHRRAVPTPMARVRRSVAQRGLMGAARKGAGKAAAKARRVLGN